MTPKEDLFAALDAAPSGYDTLRLAIVEGRITGIDGFVSVFSKCGCIKAHLARAYGKKGVFMPGAARIKHGSEIERYIYGVRSGQIPDQCEVLKNVLFWLDEWKNQEGFEL